MRRYREAKLSAALAAVGLRVRVDSWLCANYISGGHNLTGGLQQVVDGMVEMHFLWTATDYGLCRELTAAEQWEDACEMAQDGGEPTTPDNYHVPLEAGELSAVAKRRALARLVDERGVGPALALAPMCMRGKIEEVVAAAAAGGHLTTYGSATAVRYRDMDGVGQRAHREACHRHAAEQRAEEHSVLTELHRQLTQVAAGAVHVEHAFPPSLNRRLRAFLHSQAEELGLMHASRGQGAARHLVVWREVPDDSSEESSSTSSDEDNEEAQAADALSEAEEQEEGQWAGEVPAELPPHPLV